MRAYMICLGIVLLLALTVTDFCERKEGPSPKLDGAGGRRNTEIIQIQAARNHGSATGGKRGCEHECKRHGKGQQADSSPRPTAIRGEKMNRYYRVHREAE